MTRQANPNLPTEIKKRFAVAIRMHLRSLFERGVLAVKKNVISGDEARPKKLKIVDRLQLGGKQSLAVVSFDGRCYLVAMGGENVPAVTEVTKSGAQATSLGSRRVLGSRVRRPMRNEECQ